MLHPTSSYEYRYSHLPKFCYWIFLSFTLWVGAAAAQPVTDLASQCPAEYRQLVASPVTAEQVGEYYRRQSGALQWQSVARRAELQLLLEDLQYDGLHPAAYMRGLQQAATEYAGTKAVSLCTDVLISHGYLLALHHLSNGLLRQDRVEPYWVESAASLNPRPAAVELALQEPTELAHAFLQARPAQQLYTQLREHLRHDVWQMADWQAVPAGQSLKPNAVDPRVPILRQRLQQGGYLLPEQPEQLEQQEQPEAELAPAGQPEDLYTDELVAAVEAFQRDHYLEDDGIVGPATLHELNVSPQQRLAQVKANMERLRWLERYLEPDMLIVDIAGARLLYLQNGLVTWRTRTQVGTVRRQTPLLKSRVTHLTVNPTWTVPPTILRQDKLPAIRKDIGYLERNRMQVLDSQGRELDPYSVNWSAPGNIMLRQAAGPSNALGRVAIRFANPFAVYLHDTPSQHLFGRATRTVSSGCVRVEEVQRLLDWLAPDEATRQRLLTAQDSGKTRQVNLASPVPVLLAYLTVEVDADNRLRYRADSYGLDSNVQQALEQL